MIIELVLEALETLRSNLLRTVLTMIGIILGVGAVVAIMTVGQSAYDTAEKQINDSGFGNIQIRRNNGSATQALPLNKSFISFLESAEIEGVDSYEPQYSGSMVSVKNSTDDQANAVTVYSSIKDAKNLEILAGYIFTEEDLSEYGQLVIIDEYIANKLFGSPENSLGETLHINQQVLRIIGVSKTASNFMVDYGLVYIPLTLCELEPSFQTYGYSSISVMTAIGSDYENITKEIKKIIMENYGFEDEDEMAFAVENVKDMMAQVGMFMTAFSIGLSLIAAISLLVGGVGIMNIMLVNVTERTKEIGLMKALGARDRDITFQFLVESVVMTICGGLLGVALGLGFSYLLILIANTFASGFLPKFNFVISQESIIVSMIVSLTIGVAFGAYPAKKAAKLDPVEALRRD